MTKLISSHVHDVKGINKSFYGSGGRCLKIRDVYMDFEPCLKVQNLASVHPNSIKFGQMTNLDEIVGVVVSVYQLVKT